ncbi:hypothetical protein Q73A0000_14550 [Kaistella flava (ex Peng et al. 2021)]|uniref:DUF6759 domain-containing protein n=1 Tax=Kaistella flava (ex Peng et al. 2021) TaxID=2038776 RepID=A0A7M2YD07_9FLAO|nr:hypothetical protein Q73A0000_14550 [Kaistella flava (ex Peng et al. 2021)]
MLCISLCSTQIYAQQKSKDFSKIMQSTSIYEIDAYLKVAHPDDPRRSVLKPRLIEMLKEYIRTAHPADSRVAEFQQKIALLRTKPSTRISYDEMSEIIRQKQIAKYKEELNNSSGFGSVQGGSGQQSADGGSFAGSSTIATLDAVEQGEFTTLMSISPAEHKSKTVQILNSLFDNDPTSKESIVLIENKSDCNMIVRIDGPDNFKYRLAVPSHGENSIVVQKGDYLFTSKICGAQYAAQKTVQQATMVSLDNTSK